jgi:hypothetical protein
LATEIVAETTILAKQTTQEALIKTAVAGVEMGAKESKGK